MNVLSSCAPHSSTARHFYQVLHYFRELIESCEAAKAVHTTQTDGCELFGQTYWSASPSSSRDSTVATMSPISAMWQASSDAPASMFSYPSTSLYGISVGLSTTIPPHNDLSQSAMTNYLQPSIPDTTCLAWTPGLANDESNSSLVPGSSSQSGFIDSGFEHYKPYIQNFWSSEVFDARHQSGGLS